MAAKKIAVLVGSLRKESFNRKTAKAMEKLAPEGMSFDYPEFGHLGAYNQDLDANSPAEWEAFRERIRGADAVLFVTPEYNRSVPGFLKNAIDIGSRPYGKNVWGGKPAAVVTVSPGAIGGFGSNHHLRQMLVFLGMPAMAQPEAYIGGADERFNEQGELTDEGTKEFLKKFLAAFADWIERNAK
jgi:chromate reductase